MSLGAQENAYFAAKDAERRQALREKLAQQAKVAAVADQLGTHDEALAERITKLGFEGETAQVFDLVPMVHMAWADGAVEKEERALILAVLEKRGVAPGAPAWVLMEALLEARPADAWLDESLEVVKVLRERRGGRGNIVELCTMVAESAGGFLGLGTISQGERELLADISEKLGTKAETAVQQKLDA